MPGKSPGVYKICGIINLVPQASALKSALARLQKKSLKKLSKVQ
jgi:hypothetical protein